MQPHQERVIAELKELSDKHDKLCQFLVGTVFSTLSNAEQSRLRRQCAYMGLYRDVLTERIEAF